MSFETTVTVRFGDVDGAGIVFYPRYYEMLNSAVEDWCAAILGVNFHTMHLVERWGVPAVDIEAQFSVPSVLGDVLTVRIVPAKLGKSSCRLIADFSCRGEHRLKMAMTVVRMDLDLRKSKPWSPELLECIQAELPAGKAA